MRTSLSSNHFSPDIQANDVYTQLTTEARVKFDETFPDYVTLTWAGAWVDTEASGVDAEYMSWVIDWLEQNTDVYWEDGEPWIDDAKDAESERQANHA